MTQHETIAPYQQLGLFHRKALDINRQDVGLNTRGSRKLYRDKIRCHWFPEAQLEIYQISWYVDLFCLILGYADFYWR